MLRGNAGVATIVEQQTLSIGEVLHNLRKDIVDALTLGGTTAFLSEYGYLTPQLCQLQISQGTQELSLTYGSVVTILCHLTQLQRVGDGGDGLVVLGYTQQQMIEYLHLVPCCRLLFETTVQRAFLALGTFKRDELVGVQLNDERER